MSEQTGISYPTITLGGIEYTIKFTRGSLLYRLTKIHFDPTDLSRALTFAKAVDALHALITPTFPGSPEELADAILDNDLSTQQIADSIREALGKAFLPTQEKAAETAGNPAAAIQ